MTIHLPPELESSIQAAVYSGRYATLDDAMAEVAAMLEAEPADAFDAYLISGGLPLILDEWPRGAGLWDYLERAVTRPVVVKLRRRQMDRGGTRHYRMLAEVLAYLQAPTAAPKVRSCFMSAHLLKECNEHHAELLS